MPEPETTFPCETGTASFNGEEASLSVTISTSPEFDLIHADEMLNKQRLDATLRLTPAGGEDEKQKKLVDDAHAKARIEIDITGFRRTGDQIIFPVKIPKDKMNGYHSDDFATGHGFLTVHRHGPIPEKVKAKPAPADGQTTFEDHPDLGPRPAGEAPPPKTEPPKNGKAEKKGKPEPATALERDAFTRGCEAGLLGRDVTCPKELKGDLAKWWQIGYDETRNA